jgi:AraC-like DNA-binding protein
MVLIASILTMYFSIYIIRQPYILYGNLVSQLAPADNFDPVIALNLKELPAEETPKKQPAVSISEEQVVLYQSAFLHHMQTAKPYLDADFNISMLAEQLNMPVHHCSYLLNHTFNLNFRECVNQYRVKYFIEEYQLDFRNYTFETMSKESGFKNKKTFNTAFSKVTGMSPSEYFIVKGSQ